MCKIVAFSNGYKLTEQDINKIGNILLNLERDGFGYAAVGVNGTVFGEKCVASKFASRIGKQTIDLPFLVKTHEVFGEPSKIDGPAIFHGRTSTNMSGLRNTHPMQLNNWNLVHNGVVTDHGAPYSKQTDNDSEDVLYRLIEGIDSVANNLTGYYAFAAISPDLRLHIGRDRIAPLCMAFSESHDSYIFASNPKVLESIAKALKMSIGPIDLCIDDFYVVFNGNAVEYYTTFKSRGYERAEAAYATKSLGYDLATQSSTKEQQFDWPTEYWNSSDKDTDYDEYLDNLRREIRTLDETYRIYDYNGRRIDSFEFHKMDAISQTECRIFRADDSEVFICDLALE